MRNYETNLINMPYNFIKENIGELNFEEVDVVEDLKLSGKYILMFHKKSQDKERQQHDNKLKKRQKIRIKMNVNKNFKAVIEKHKSEFWNCCGFVVSGFTKCKVHLSKDGLLYHELWRQYLSGLYKKLVEDEGIRLEEICDKNLVHDTTYSEAHALKEYVH